MVGVSRDVSGNFKTNKVSAHLVNLEIKLTTSYNLAIYSVSLNRIICSPAAYWSRMLYSVVRYHALPNPKLISDFRELLENLSYHNNKYFNFKFSEV